MSFWKESEYQLPEENTELFFEKLKKSKKELEPELKGFTYRQEQQNYALDIMKAIREKQILLIEAGVGIGKSYGYLIPIFYTKKNITSFKKVVISTSTIALQQQLLKDVQKISKMLNIPIEAGIAKGINNYACLKKISDLEYRLSPSSEERRELEKLEKEMRKLASCDKEELKEFSNNIWEKIKISSRGKCSNCGYSKQCLYRLQQKKLSKSNIIITNHANFVKDLIEDGELAKNANMFIFDEAHQLEGNMRNIQEKSLELDEIKMVINKVCSSMASYYRDNTLYSIEESDESTTWKHASQLKQAAEQLFSAMRKNASHYFSQNKKNNDLDQSITDYNRLPFTYTKTIQEILKKIIEEIKILKQEMKNYEKKYTTTLQTKESSKINEIYFLFKDMYEQDKSTNIYWVDFYKTNKITLHYTKKSNINITKGILSKKVPVIYTSGTMIDNKNSYQYFRKGIDLIGDTNQTIIEGASYPSPYNYKKNSLFYCNPKLANPNNYKSYIIDLACEIDQLLRATEGKALVLFTSKKCMKDIYERLSQNEYNFPLLLQTENNTVEVKKIFQEDVNSCLFATGAFWEGIDIKGKSLSNLIITHLPFDVVDPISQYKASIYATDSAKFNEVYIPSMLVKFTQAAGRLIRDSKDVGIISCLDSRFPKYQNLIEEKTRMVNYTENISDVIQFAEPKILNSKTRKKKTKSITSH